jgi:hypothetical protein
VIAQRTPVLGVLTAAVFALALSAGVPADASDWSASVTVARGRAPAGGTFVLKAHRALRGGSGRFCFALDRRARRSGRKLAYELSGCYEDVPARRALRGAAAYSCYTNELEVAGLAASPVARVQVELSDGRRLPAHLFRSRRLDFRGSLFMLIVRTPARDIDDMHPAALRAFDRRGRLLGVQGFPSGGASGWGCFSEPPPAVGHDAT